MKTKKFGGEGVLTCGRLRGKLKASRPPIIGSHNMRLSKKRVD